VVSIDEINEKLAEDLLCLTGLHRQVQGRWYVGDRRWLAAIRSDQDPKYFNCEVGATADEALMKVAVNCGLVELPCKLGEAIDRLAAAFEKSFPEQGE